MKRAIGTPGALLAIGVLAALGGCGQPAPDAPLGDPGTLRATLAGKVVGMVGSHGANIWLGIPFARPPTGKLRWRAPQPAVPWTGVVEALAVAPPCVQMASRLTGDGPGSPRKLAGSENCLYLNIYAPQSAAGLPVMVWVHGGGNTVGHGGSYNGARLATTSDVVVVTINYRLGHLGWFAHPALHTGSSADDSGNYGTLDIVRALEWVRDNIAAFGGDPGNVTLFGESAGGTNTMTLVVSPRAAGLFHRGIVQSGGLNITTMARAQNFSSDGGHPMSAREIVSHLLVNDGIAADLNTARARQQEMTSTALSDYLYGKPVDELYAMFDNSGFGTINVPTLLGDGFVLPKEPVEALLSNRDTHNSVPMMLGSNRDEPSRFLVRSPKHVQTILGTLRRFKDEGRYLRAVKYGALGWKERGVDRLASHLAASGNPDVYAYRFDWDEQGSDWGFDLGKAIGAGHALEIAFVFGNFTDGIGLGHLYEQSEHKDALARSMMSYWGEFAHHGNPGRGRDGTEVEWLAWGVNGKHTIVLDTPSDQGIFMMEGIVTDRTIKSAIANDPEIADQRERCELYVSVFSRSGGFDKAEYDALPPQGCTSHPPEAFR